MSLTSSNSMRTAHFLRAPDSDPLDDDTIFWAHERHLDEMAELGYLASARTAIDAVADTRAQRKVRKAFEAAERAGRDFTQFGERWLVNQDGPDFYDCETGDLLATYPELVHGDYDMDGAVAARREFMRTHGQFYVCS